MARIRTIKPEFWSNEQVLECSLEARLLFIGLWNFCDDEGRHKFSPKTIKARIFPAEDYSADDVRRMLDELCANELLIVYEHENKQFLQVTGWNNQRIDRPQPARNPCPLDEGSTIIRGTFAAEGRRDSKEGGSDEPKIKKPLPKNFSISERVRKWADEKGHTNLDAHLESFTTKAKAKGYKYVDWDAAFQNAIRDNWANIQQGDNGPRARVLE